MKKIFRLASAEFNKIFYRPSIFILTAMLIITLVASNLLFKPQNTASTKLEYTSNSVGGIYMLFTGSSQTEVTKATIDSAFFETYSQINEKYNSITNDDKLKTLTDKTLSLNIHLTESLKDEILRISTLTESEFIQTKSITISIFNSLKQKSSELLSYMAKIKGETLNFYFAVKDYDSIYYNVENLYNAFPKNFNDFKKDNFITFGNSLTQNFSLKTSLNIVAKLEKITIDIEQYDKVINTYYTNPLVKLNDKYFHDITAFYEVNYESTDAEKMSEINKLIAKYYSYAEMNKTILLNKFELIRIGDKSDTSLKDLIGYSEISKYKLNEQNTIYDYLLTNEAFDYEYLTSFNFNKSSGPSSNAFDYTVYSMQILSILIIIFSIFYACSSIAGDQSEGMMKMIAIRPYTRNKLFAGKYLSCVFFGVMLTIIGVIASFVVGAISFGVPLNNCLVVFNSSTILTINPIILLLIYIVSLIINLLFYISLAMLICLICKSNTLSVFLTTLVYGTQIILNALVGSVWLKFTPFGHFDLFKYFGNASLGFLSMNILPDANFVVSAVILGAMIVLFNILSHFIFKTKDIA